MVSRQIRVVCNCMGLSLCCGVTDSVGQPHWHPQIWEAKSGEDHPQAAIDRDRVRACDPFTFIACPGSTGCAWVQCAAAFGGSCTDVPPPP